MAVGRISGPLLKANLERNGIDLAVETSLLYIDVNNGRIGINTTTPHCDLDVNGTICSERIDTNFLTVASNYNLGNVNITSTVGNLELQPATEFDRTVIQGDLEVTGSIIGYQDGFTIADDGSTTAFVGLNTTLRLSDGDDMSVVISTDGTHEVVTFSNTSTLDSITSRGNTTLNSISVSSIDGDLQGSVFGDDSTLLIDGINNKIVGQLEVSNPIINGTITSSDSSPITIAQSLVVSDDLTVENNLYLNNPVTLPAGTTLDGNPISTGDFDGDFNSLTNIPTTLSGYGITDAAFINGPFVGDLQGSVFADDSTLLVDGVSGTIPSNVIVGTLNNNLIGNVTGNLVGNVDGDLQGSVFGDDSTLIVDGINNSVIATSVTTPQIVAATTLNINTGGDFTVSSPANIQMNATSGAVYIVSPITDLSGILQVSTIDSADSSAITFVPSVTFESDVAVQNDLNVTNTVTANQFIGDGSQLTGLIANFAALNDTAVDGQAADTLIRYDGAFYVPSSITEDTNGDVTIGNQLTVTTGLFTPLIDTADSSALTITPSTVFSSDVTVENILYLNNPPDFGTPVDLPSGSTLGGVPIGTTEGGGDADTLNLQPGSYYLDAANLTGNVPADFIRLGIDTVGGFVENIIGTANEIEITSDSTTESATLTVGLPNDVTIGNELTVTTGLFTPLIDTTDSSSLTITPATIFNSDVTVENDLIVTNKITASVYYGDGSNLTGISTTTTYADLTDTDITGRTTNSLTRFDGANYVPTLLVEDASGNITVSGQLNVSTIDTADSSAITITPAAIFSSDVTIENDLAVTNKITATAYYGDGSNLTGISTTTTYADLTDTDITGRTTDSLTRFDGVNYVPTLLSEDASGNVTISGQLNVSILDTADSSAITITPAAIFSSDVTVENDLYVNNNIRGDDLKLQSTTSETYLTATLDGAVSLYYDNSQKLSTYSSGVTINDTLQTPNIQTDVFELGYSDYLHGTMTGSISNGTTVLFQTQPPFPNAGSVTFQTKTFALTTTENNHTILETSSSRFPYSAGDESSIKLYADDVERLATTSIGVTITGQLSVSTIDTADSSAITITPAAIFSSDVTVENDLNVNNDVIISGNLTVQGTTTQVDSNVVNIGDSIITLNSDEVGAPTQNAGIEVERGTSANVQFIWNESTDKWQVTEDGTIYYNILTNQGNQVALGTDTTGDYIATITGTANEVEVTGSGGETAAVTIGLPDDITIGGELTVTTGLFTPLIDTADSSALTITPATTFSSDVTVENNFTVQTDTIFVSSNSQVGIGTSSPQAQLDVKNGTTYSASGDFLARIQQNYNSTGKNGLSVMIAGKPALTNSKIFEAAVGWNGTETGYYPVFSIDGTGQTIFSNGEPQTERMRIANNGYVGIGTSSPDSYLHVDDKDGTGPTVIIEGGGTNQNTPADGEQTLFLKTGDGTGDLSTGIGFFATFENTPADTNDRRAADIRAGFDGGAWGNEYISFHIGKGTGSTSNDAAAMTDERLRVTKTAVTSTVSLDITGDITSSGTLFVSTIDTTDSSALTITPSAVFSSDVTVENILYLNNPPDFGAPVDLPSGSTLGGVPIGTTEGGGDADTLNGQPGSYYLDGANLTGSLPNDYVTLGTDTTGNYVATISGTANEVEVTGSGSETAAVTIGLPNDVTIGNELTVTTGLFTPLIDTADSSALTITPAAIFSSDVTVENDLVVTNKITATEFVGVTYANLDDVDITGRTNNSLTKFDGANYVPTLLKEFSDGDLRPAKDIEMLDNQYIVLGSNRDLWLFSDGTTGIIQSPIEPLKIRVPATGTSPTADGLLLQSTTNETLASFLPNYGVYLYHNDVLKLETTSDGITVHGNITQDSIGTLSYSTLSTSTIDSLDSSAVTIVPAAVFNSDVTVENDLVVTNKVTATEYYGDGSNLTGISTTTTYAALTDTDITGRTTDSLTRFDGANYVPTAMSEDASGNVTVSGQLNVSTIDTADSSAITITPAAIFSSDVTVENDLNVNNDVIISGNLTVQGTTTQVDSNVVNIGDSIITLNSDETGTPTQNAGIEVERGTSANVQFIWNESTDTWQVTEDGATYYNLLTDAGDQVALGTDTTGDYIATITGTANEVEVTGSGGETAAVTIGLPDNVTIGGELTVTTGLFTPLIDTADSSSLTITPATTFSSDVTVENDLIVTNKITATAYYGDGSNLTGISTTTTYAALTDTDITGRTTDSLTRFDGAAYVPTAMSEDASGNVTIAGQLNIGTIDTADSSAITVTPAAVFSADVTVENDLVVTNKVTATEFIGNGSQLTNINANNITSGEIPLGTRTSGNYVATISGTANEVEVTGSGGETAAVTVGLPDNVTIGGELTVTTGLFTPLIDTADSSALTITPATTFSSDVTVENVLYLNNPPDFGAPVDLPSGSTLGGVPIGTTEGGGDADTLNGQPGSYYLNAENLTGNVPADFIRLGIDTIGGFVENIVGTTNEIEISGDSTTESATLTVGLPDNVTISNELTVTTGLFTPLIDTADSSTLTITPATTFSSDVTVENDLIVTNKITATAYYGDGSNLTGISTTTTYADLTDTDITGRTTDSLTRFDGVNYVPTSLTEDSSGNVTISGQLSVSTIDTADSSAITITPAAIFNSDVTVENDLNVTNDVIIGGNLTVQGTTTQVDSNVVNIGDSIITLNADETGAPTQNAGIEVERGTSANVQFIWNESTDKWQVTEDGTIYYNILTNAGDQVALGSDTTGDYVATISGTANEVEVIGSGSETAAVTIGLPDNVTIANELTVTTGLFTPSIDTADSSTLTITPATTFSSDVTVENDVVVTNKITASEFIGDGVLLTNINADNITSGEIPLGTRTSGNYVATIAGTANEVEVIGSGSETAAVTIGLPDNVTIGGELTVTTGLFTPLIDTADSSALTITPATTFSSDVTVENILYLNNPPDFGAPVDLPSGSTLGGVPIGTTEGGGDADTLNLQPGSYYLDAANLTGNVPADFIRLGIDTIGGFVETIVGTANEIEITGDSTTESATLTVGLPDNVTISNELTVTTGLFTPLIDTADSSTLTITPAAVFNSDVTVENDLNVTNDVTADRFFGDGSGLYNVNGLATIVGRTEEFPTVTDGSPTVTMSSAYDIDALDVFLNGVRLRPSTDYTVSGTDLTFNENLTLNDTVAIYIFKYATKIEEFPTVVNGSADVTLGDTYSLSQLDVYLNGSKLKPTTDFTLAGTTLTFSNTLVTDDIVSVIVYSEAVIGGGQSFASLSDVDVAGQATDTLIRYNGNDYVPTATTEDASGNVTISGQLSVSEIDSADSSSIFFTPAAVFQSDVYVQNDLDVTNDVVANAFYGDGSNLTGITVDTSFVDLSDTNVIGQTTNTLIKYNGSEYVPTNLSENASGDVTVSSKLNVSLIDSADSSTITVTPAAQFQSDIIVDNDVKVTNNLNINDIQHTVANAVTYATTSASSITNFPGADYSSGNIIIQVKDNVTSQVQICKISIVHDTSTVSTTEYSNLYTGGVPLATFTGVIRGGYVHIDASGASNNSTTYKVVKTLLKFI